MYLFNIFLNTHRFVSNNVDLGTLRLILHCVALCKYLSINSAAQEINDPESHEFRQLASTTHKKS